MNGPSFDPAIGQRVRASSALLHQLSALFEGAGELLAHTERPFALPAGDVVGHTLLWAFDGASDVAKGDAGLNVLTEHEFRIPGYKVAFQAVTVAANPRPDRLEAEIEFVLMDEIP